VRCSRRFYPICQEKLEERGTLRTKRTLSADLEGKEFQNDAGRGFTNLNYRISYG